MINNYIVIFIKEILFPDIIRILLTLLLKQHLRLMILRNIMKDIKKRENL